VSNASNFLKLGASDVEMLDLIEGRLLGEFPDIECIRASVRQSRRRLETGGCDQIGAVKVAAAQAPSLARQKNDPPTSTARVSLTIIMAVVQPLIRRHGSRVVDLSEGGHAAR
jgi:hypothetical protein